MIPAHETQGAGPPVLMLAGLASDRASWGPVVAPLAARFRLVLPDNRGCGRTPYDPPFAFADFADDAVRLLDHLAIEVADIVGHSMGAMIAIGLAHRHPARARRLVLAAGGTAADLRAAAAFAALAQARRDGLGDAAFLALFHPWLFAPAFFATPGPNAAAIAAALAYPYRQSPEGYGAQIAAAAGHVVPPLGDIAHPALVLIGDDDLVSPPVRVREQLAALPNATFEVISNAGHALHWDQPYAFAGAVERFLA